QRLTTHLIRTPHTTLSVAPSRDEALNEHAKLVAAISAGDETAARNTAREHMETARKIRLDLLRKSASY
ncbi:MAG: GntR family transcriptional regulator, partial [Pseudarthrobacter sp.]|nr:GntR family transcriptional regulator [Pseudarthrobacter sp.]